MRSDPQTVAMVVIIGVLLVGVFCLPRWYCSPWRPGEVIQVVPGDRPINPAKNTTLVPVIIDQRLRVLRLSPATIMVEKVIPEQDRKFWAVVGRCLHWWRPVEVELVAVANNEIVLRDWVAQQAALLR